MLINIMTVNRGVRSAAGEGDIGQKRKETDHETYD